MYFLSPDMCFSIRIIRITVFPRYDIFIKVEGTCRKKITGSE